jgi:Zinc finger, C2H2 type
MATELVIKSWCDTCLSADVHTPGETLTLPALFGRDAFEVEACKEHAQPLADALADLAAHGARSPGKGTPKVPTTTARRVRTDDATEGGACPVCGTQSTSLSALRYHLRRQHEKSLGDVGLAAANVVCPHCGSKFPGNTGLSAHVRSAHGRAEQSA